MCGIIGYVGGRQAYPILFAGLKQLEYRGYDSAETILRLKNRSFYKEELLIRKKMNICSQKFADIVEKNEHIMNILPFIKFDNYYCQMTFSFKKLLSDNVLNYSKASQKLNVSRKTIARMLSQKNHWANMATLLSLTDSLQIQKITLFSNITSIKTHNSFPIPFDVKNLLSASFFRIIGHILGDGGIHVIEKEQKYRAFYVNNEKNLLDSFKEDIRVVFGDIKIYNRERLVQGDEIWLPTTLGYLLYNMLDYESFKKQKRVPAFILNTDDKKLLGAFLQALYDDEGYLYPKKHMIVIAQKRKELLDGIRKAVLNLGIHANPIRIHNSKTRTVMHYFSITGKKNITMFADLIGFKHPMKRKKLDLLIGKYKGC